MNTTSKNQNITFLLPNFRTAGVEKVTITLANEMRRQGYVVSFLVFNKSGELIENIDTDIEIINLNIKRSLFSFFKLFNFFRKNKTTLISVYNHISVITLIANLATFKKSNIFICEHTTLSQMNKAKPSYKNRIITLLMKILYPLSKGVIAVSSGVADDLSETLNLKRENIKVLYNPLDIELISKLSQSTPNHRWLTNKTNPIILAIGRLDIAKNFSLLINAFAKITDQTDAKLLILGEGELRNELEQEIEKLQLRNRCELAGYISNPYPYLYNSDILVLSSNFEGLPTVLIESLAVNTPVISTDCPSGPAEILEGGKWGTLIPTNDINSLSNAMLEQLNKPITINLQERAKFFDVEPTTQRYIDYIFNQN